MVKQKKKVIYASCSLPYYVDLAVSLNKKLGWEPCYWIGRKKNISQFIKLKFKNVPFHDHHDAIYLSKSPILSDKNLYPIDTKLIKKLLFCEKISIKMMDRIDNAGILNYDTRIKLYYKHISHWSYVIDTFKPDILFNSSAPHQIYDYILYELCKLKKVKTIMVGLGFDLNLLYLKNDLREGSGCLLPIYNRQKSRKIKRNDLKKSSLKVLDKIKTSYENAIPKRVHLQIHEKRINLYGELTLNFVKLPMKFIQLFFTKLAKKKSVSFREWYYNSIGSKLRLNSIVKYYVNISSKSLNYNAKYIYLPLSYQPELASSPEGDIYVDQILMINIISKSIPKDWKIYVKEHPVQFTYTLGTNKNVRSIKFYKEIKKIDKVQMVNFNENPFKLIDNCKAVATITGTTGWEALIREKPVLYFGYPWWQGCHGSFKILNFTDCKMAISKLLKNFKIDLNEVFLFIKILEENSCDGDFFWNEKLQYKTSKNNKVIKSSIRNLSSLIYKSTIEKLI